MELMHNVVFRIISGPDAGLYRVILDEIQIGRTCVVRLDPPIDSEAALSRGGRKKAECPKNSRKKPIAPMLGTLQWFARADLEGFHGEHQLVILEIEPEFVYLAPLQEKDQARYDWRCDVMRDFLSLDVLREHILGYQGIHQLIRLSIERTGSSKFAIYKLFSLLCRLGFSESSLRPRLDRCGAPGKPKPCDPGGRQKAGAKTVKQRIADAYGEKLPPEQPGMNTEWRQRILAADAGIRTPKPSMPDRCNLIIASSFIKRYRQENGELIAIEPKLGEYPNRSQIRRVLETDIPRLERLLQQTTKGHFLRNMRGLTGRAWQGVVGPGHTWAIDSTIGDIYLRSSVNRAWIIGRPIVYIIVDVWSTAIVGFFVCLTGPSWDMAKVALFSSAADPQLIADLWGYQPVLSLSPTPTMCCALMCDRGEYLSRGAKQTGAVLIPTLSYAPPYRPDFKGSVEVPHRIEKDRQYIFVPGAIDQRRQEYELRRFNAHDAVLTVREYTHLLYTLFTEYNLSANRMHRLDAHMAAAGVFPSPAGLWRWGHEVGIGVRRAISQQELIITLLPATEARVGRSGVLHGGQLYESDVINEQQWSAHARTLGGWDIPVNSFPGSLAKIWTPNPAEKGLLELDISDNANASPKLTFEEVADAFAFDKAKRADVNHTRYVNAVWAIDRVKDIVNHAKTLTTEALQHDSGPAPNLTDARMIETFSPGMKAAQPTAEIAVAEESSEVMDAHIAMMQSIFSAANYMEGMGHE